MRVRNFLQLRNFSILLLTALAVLLLLPQRSDAASATLGIIPSSATYTRGQSFSVTVVVNTDTAINAAEATVRFSSTILEATSVSTSGSKFTLWASQPSYSNSAGTVTFSGGLPSPGFTGNGGKIISITFKAKATGTASLSFSGAQVLANDGSGTNILSRTGGSTLTIKAPAEAPPPEPTRATPSISSSSHPDSNAWYTSRDISASWTGGTDVRGFNVVLDTTANTNPPETDQGSGRSGTYTASGDGVYYLHVRARYDSGWSDTRHFAAHIDSTAPESFVVNVDHADSSARTATVIYESTDATSGIARYDMKIDGGEFTERASPFGLVDLALGEHTLVVRAIDKAGNVQESSTTFSVTEGVAPTVILDIADEKLFGYDGDAPIIELGTALTLRGYAKPGVTIRIIIRSHEAVYEFPVEEILDPNPVQPAPEGFVSWKVEILDDWAPGDHTVTVNTVDAQGIESAAAPTLTFHVVTDVARIGSTLVPRSYILLLVSILAGVFGIAVAVLLFFFIRLRRTMRKLRKREKNKADASLDQKT